MIIAIDGTSSSGKSSLARKLGKTLNITVLGTGSIYRAITYKALNLNIDYKNDQLFKQMLDTTIIESVFENGNTYIKIDRIKVDNAILSSHEVSVVVAEISPKPYVREFVRNIQHQIANNNPNIIVEGRDIGSVVFPNADVKLFVDADTKTRAKRRLNDYNQKGKKYTLAQVEKELIERDNQDRHRAISPLVMTSDAIIIDTSSLSIDQSVNKVLNILKDKNLI